LISNSLYEKCVSIGNSFSSSTPLESVWQEIKGSILNNLPDLNREVLYEFLDLLKTISSPENVKTNLMNSQNLSVVTASGILRPANRGTDLQATIARMRDENTFARLLIDTWYR